MNPRRLSALALLLLCVGMAPAAPANGTCQAASGDAVLPLVELYTSEGCDSCPPADRWLRETFPPDAPGPPRAAVLAFHVDYWDRLGWPDRFAQHAFSERQRAVVSAGGGATVYTPQVLVQGHDAGLWRGEGVLRAERDAAAHTARARIALTARPVDDAVAVDAQATLAGSGVGDARLQLALTDSGLVSSVTAGENRGVRLEHDHVVRALAPAVPFARDGHAATTVRLPLPRERGRQTTIVGFVQDREERRRAAIRRPAAVRRRVSAGPARPTARLSGRCAWIRRVSRRTPGATRRAGPTRLPAGRCDPR